MTFRDTGTLFVAWLLVLAGVAVALPAVWLSLLSVAALPGRGRSTASAMTGLRGSRLVVVVPAHDEALLIARCLTSLRAQDYPVDLFRVVVVADNCTDDTAAVAQAAGADVMVRDEPHARGKGRALRWVMDRLVQEDVDFDAVVVVDADSVADSRLLSRLSSRLEAGADAVQGEYLVLAEPGTGSGLRSAAFLLFHRARFSGLAALGLPCSLVGNGMLFSRRVLERHAWGAFSNVEDLEHTVDLRLAGIHPVFAADARIQAPAPTGGRAGATQRMRWEGGRAHVVRHRLPAVLAAAARRRDASLAGLAVELITPPLGLLVLSAIAGLVMCALAWWALTASVWIALPWALGVLAIATHVLVGLSAARAPARMYLALLAAPWFLVAKLGTYARLLRGSGADRWIRTERPAAEVRAADIEPPAASRTAMVCGTRIDLLEFEGVVERITTALAAQEFVQVCTVNMQFLVSAWRHADVREILRRSELNVPDGAPVVWLTRLLGRAAPGRVAGADLVPAIMEAAARTGARVFLLGGVQGVTEQAARAMRERHPGLEICGSFEPPVLPFEQMDDGAILKRITVARPDILLVAFGHPKQERWIARNRHRLDVSLAMGVGCCLDLAAGRSSRAPGLMQRLGLEWLHRLTHEPRRLVGRYASELLWLAFVLVPLTMTARLRGVAAPQPPRPMPRGRRIAESPALHQQL